MHCLDDILKGFSTPDGVIDIYRKINSHFSLFLFILFVLGG